MKEKLPKIIVSTGKVERTWEITKSGLRTVSMIDLISRKDYSNGQSKILCDWSYNGLINSQSNAKLISLTAEIKNDDGFTSNHLEVVAEFEYPAVETFVKYVIWAYPGAPAFEHNYLSRGMSENTSNMLIYRIEKMSFLI
jgi:hypothetical protein